MITFLVNSCVSNNSKRLWKMEITDIKCHPCSQPYCRQLTDNKYYCHNCEISHDAAFNLCMPHLWETQSLSFITEACFQPQTGGGVTSSTVGSDHVDGTSELSSVLDAY